MKNLYFKIFLLNKLNWKIRCWRWSMYFILLGMFYIQSLPIFAEDQLVSQKIYYRMPDAGEVFLIWGINGWQIVPKELQTRKTIIKNRTLHTRMDCRGETFFTEIKVPSGTMIEYGFLISKKRDGSIANIWEADGDQNFHIKAMQDNVIDVHSTLILAKNRTTAGNVDSILVKQKICYQIAGASEVHLLWGINGWSMVPRKIRPEGTTIHNSVLCTPMLREGDTFMTELIVPYYATINYGFYITKKKSGTDIRVWDGSNEPTKEYSTIAGKTGQVMVSAQSTIVKQLNKAVFDIDFRRLSIISLIAGIIVCGIFVIRKWYSKFWLLLERLLKSNLLLLAILLLGVLLRIYDLGAESLWMDECDSIRIVKTGLSGIFECSSTSVNPPLYFIILHSWVRLFGESEFALRFPSVLFGVLSLIMIYKVAKLIFNKKVGLFSTLLLILSVFHIEYSQEARDYSVMVLLALISMYFFILLLKRVNASRITGYILSSILLMYTHFYGLFIILIQNIYFISTFMLIRDKYKLKFKVWSMLQGLLFVLFLPWIYVLMKQVLTIQEGYWIPIPTLYSILETFVTYSAKSNSLFIYFLLLLFFSILPLKKIIGKNSQSKSDDRFSWKSISLACSNIYLLLLWMLIPIILPFVVSLVATPIYYTRYTIAAALAFYILIANGIQNTGNKYVKYFLVVSIILYSLSGVNTYYTKTTKSQWRTAADYVDIKAKSGDLLLFNPPGAKDNCFAYYFKRNDVIQKILHLDIDIVTERSKFLGERKSIDSIPMAVEGYNRVWLVLTPGNDKQGRIKKKLSELYWLADHRKYVHIELCFFEKVIDDQ